MSFLNYHHLRYFHAIARGGNLTRAAEELHISPSALSIQLGQLEESLGLPLFYRANKRLTLTEAGHLALSYADKIFKTGEELYDTLKHRAPKQRQLIRMGAVTTLSRNFQVEFIKPLLNRADLELVLRTGPLPDLLSMLDGHTIDLILSNSPVSSHAHQDLHSHLIDTQEMILVAHRHDRAFHFPNSLQGRGMILPSAESNIRRSFNLLMDQHDIRPMILAEVDDMPMLRLLARETDAITLVPRVVVRDELKNRSLVELYCMKQINESFYAITPSRHFPNSLIQELLPSPKSKKKRHQPNKK